MSKTAPWEPAARIDPPAFEGTSLLGFFARIDPSPQIRRGLLMIPTPEWRREPISDLFGLEDPGHCFHVGPYNWARFHEPQITRGFQHFLGSGTREQRTRRMYAFVKAAELCAGRDLAIAPAAITSASCTAEENRTDLLIELACGSRRFGVSLEAKFGHALTKGQLPKAKKYAMHERQWAEDDTILLVVAPHVAELSKSIMRVNRCVGWNATSWNTLLLHLEAWTQFEDDCPDYRRFRRTVWSRAN